MNNRFVFRAANGAAISVFSLALLAAPALAERYELLTGVDALRYPGVGRTVFPSSFPTSGVPGTFYDGDRLAGTSDAGPVVVYQGAPPGPMFAPNQFGSLSFFFRRGSVPLGPPGQYPFMGIEFLGGPLLDLDGDATDASRSLVPVSGRTAVVMPGTSSFIDLELDTTHTSITLRDADITGNNEGAPGVGPDVATILVTLANTAPTCPCVPGDTQCAACLPGPAINPACDTRIGDVSPLLGESAPAGVFRIHLLGYEFWEDAIDPNSSSASVLGTMQFLGTLDGWLVERDASTGQFPTLAGAGLGSTLWPQVYVPAPGQTVNTANGLSGGTATIRDGVSGDVFSAPGNGGVALSDFGGDLGAYLDAVVVPNVPATSTRFVYLQSAGIGVNNSFDPVFTDTNGYDVVLIAANHACAGRLRCDSNCDGLVDNSDIDAFVTALVAGPEAYAAAYPGCAFVCNNDANGDGIVDNGDIDAFVQCLVGGP